MSSIPGGDVAGAYDQWASQYDDNENATRDLDAHVVRGAPLQLSGRDVLEIGCGTGKNTRWLASAARLVIALDFSPGMLAVARRRVTDDNVRLVEHDLRLPWPVGDRAVDVVMGNLVLEHVEHLDLVYREAARVLRPAGQLFLCELHPFKQLEGGQARFTDHATGEIVRVQAFRHSVSEYVNGGIAVGLRLCSLGEWSDQPPVPGAAPRLISVMFGGLAG